MMDDLRSVLVETLLEDDKVGAGDIGLVLTLAPLYLQVHQVSGTITGRHSYLDPYWDPCQDLA